MSIDQLIGLRNRVMPMLELAAAEYEQRVPAGYPHLIDAADRGMFGMQLDPQYAIYFSAEDDQLFADMSWREPRNDNRSTAGREKFAGEPVVDRRVIEVSTSDAQLRNLIAELMSRYNFQPGLIHITDQ